MVTLKPAALLTGVLMSQKMSTGLGAISVMFI